MAGGHRKFRSAHAFGKRRKRRPRARTLSPARPSAAENSEEAGCASAITAAAPAIADAIAASQDHTRAVRVDTPLVSDAEKVAIECRASDVLQDLSSKSATKRKRSFFRDSDGAATPGTPFTVVSLELVNELLQCMKCGVCGGPGRISKEDREYGIAAKLVLTCDECGKLRTVWSSPRAGGDAAHGPFEINVLAVRAAMSTGNGQTALNDIFSALNISRRGLHTKTYQDYVKLKMNPAAQKAAACVIDDCASTVKTVYSELNYGNPGNIAVSFDGTWLTRGHSSHICVGTVIELFTGYVLDFVVLSNFCLGCQLGPKEDNPRYAEWLAGHTCQKNTSSKPGQMEVEAAQILFGRSLERHGLRYTTMLCDGDSRAFNSLQEAQVYGFVPIEKEDCVNHVHKRMGTALRNLLQKQRAEGKPSLGGKGKLTGELVTKLTSYYGWALQSNQGSIEAMNNAVWATFYHVASTDASPQHSHCPTGEESWCKYNKAVAKQETPPNHRYNLPEYVVDALRPIYTRLSDKKLLERCQRGKTQNPNESLHSVIWSLVSKNKHASLFTVEAAVAEAVARFNAGKGRADAAILKELHLQQSVVAAERCSEKDSRRLVASEKKHEHAENFKHAMKRKRTKENDDDYIPGGF